MAIFKKKYETAETDIKRTLRKIEEKKKQTGAAGIENELLTAKSNIDFAERIGLLSATQIMRLRQIVYEIETKEERSRTKEKPSDTESACFSHSEYKEILKKEHINKASPDSDKGVLNKERNCEEREI